MFPQHTNQTCGQRTPSTSQGHSSDSSAVISPMQERLPLAWSAKRITRFAILPDLRHVPCHRLPSSDLAGVLLWNAPTHPIAAIPLEPPARVVRINPALPPPFRQGLTGVHAEVVESTVAARGRQLRPREPARRKFGAAIGYILSAENAEFEHLLRRQVWPKLGAEVATSRSCQLVAVALLHLVVDDDYKAAHLAPTSTSKNRLIISATRYNLQLPTGHPFGSKYPSTQISGKTTALLLP